MTRLSSADQRSTADESNEDTRTGLFAGQERNHGWDAKSINRSIGEEVIMGFSPAALAAMLSEQGAPDQSAIVPIID